MKANQKRREKRNRCKKCGKVKAEPKEYQDAKGGEEDRR